MIYLLCCMHENGGGYMKLLNQYRGLKREIYVLFYGRVMTSMGGLVWPLMTLILSNKMGMSATQIANLLLVMSIIQLPCTLLGGKVADHFNKKNVIIVCDMITVISYLICAFIPLSNISIALFYIAGMFASFEYPSYDALVADLTSPDEREKAYSLNYLGMNLGLVLSPTIGGLLFANHLNIAFLITSLATFSSTALIFFFIKDIKREVKEGESVNVYEDGSTSSALEVLLHNRSILLYTFLTGLIGLVYSQFNFLIPLNMEASFGEMGATFFGMLTSTNAIVVIVGTPILTNVFSTMRDIHKMVLGVIFEVVGLAMYIFIQNMLWLSFVSMIIFTIGEICNTLGSSPYMTKRIPASHRGRIYAVGTVFATLFQSVSQKGVAYLVDTQTLAFVWCVITVIGVIGIIGIVWLSFIDRIEYPLLYSEE